jgi:Pentapeptide repeats (8 copies)
MVADLQIRGYFAQNREQQLARWATWADPKDLPKLESDLRASRFQVVTTIAQIGGGAALLVGVYFTYQNLNATREGQVTDRFIRAVDQLGAKDKDGNPAPEIRLGGVYGLRRVAQDSREDYQPIRKILNDYIIINALWHEPAVTTKAAPGSSVGASPSATAANDIHPRADIQAALDFFRQPTDKNEKLTASDLIRLPNADLRGADLLGADLEGAHLKGADLSKAIGLTREQISSAFGDARTKLPPDLGTYRPASWK